MKKKEKKKERNEKKTERGRRGQKVDTHLNTPFASPYSAQSIGVLVLLEFMELGTAFGAPFKTKNTR